MGLNNGQFEEVYGHWTTVSSSNCTAHQGRPSVRLFGEDAKGTHLAVLLLLLLLLVLHRCS